MGYIHLDPSDVNEFVIDMYAFTRSTNAEDGCLFFAAALDDAPAGRMLITERWQNQNSLTAHLQTPDTAAFVEKWASRMKGDVLKFDASNERSLME